MSTRDKQRRLVLSILKKEGFINEEIARANNMARAAPRIFELRQMGWPIITDRVNSIYTMRSGKCT